MQSPPSSAAAAAEPWSQLDPATRLLKHQLNEKDHTIRKVRWPWNLPVFYMLGCLLLWQGAECNASQHHPYHPKRIFCKL